MDRYIIALWQSWLPHSETAFADYWRDERFFAGISLFYLEMDRKQAVADLEMAIRNSERYVESLALSGYRSYDSDLAGNKIEWNDVNIIIGANGAGKSNLISFLEMVSFMMTRGLRNYTARQGGAQSLFYFGEGRTERIKGELQIHDTDGEQREHVFIWTGT